MGPAELVITPADPHAPELVRGLDGPLAPFNLAGILSAADVHAALRISRLAGCEDPLVTLGIAFAVRAPRFGHVYADLDALADTVTDEDGRAVPLPPEAWPDVDEWAAAIAASPLAVADPTPVHLDGTRLYLDRYWRHEHAVALALRGRVGADSTATPLLDTAGEAALAGALPDSAEQLRAAQAAVRTRLAVIAGGPGTGKTRTIARLVGVLSEHADRSGQPVQVAIAAPTGKAAARLGEALREAAAQAPGLRSSTVRPAPTTLHRLLGGTWSRTRFRHHADNPLPWDLVIVDEVSMVSLSMLDSLLGALRPDARLVLVGDPDQLAAVEAGAVLGDIIAAAPGTPLADQVVTLTRNHRSGQVISELAGAVRAGDVDAALDLLVRNPEQPHDHPVSLITVLPPGRPPHAAGALAGIAAMLTDRARTAMARAAAGDVTGALEATMSAKVLCAHRRGVDGVGVWNSTVEGWAWEAPSYRRPEWYAGRPVMASRNDASLGVFNGDIGVVIRDGDRLRIAVDGRPGRPVEHRRVGEVQTVHAMTVHKSQGSQFDDVVIVLPEDPSPILTRELLYTAITRAKRSVAIVGTAEALRRGIQRPVSRASALPERLFPTA